MFCEFVYLKYVGYDMTQITILRNLVQVAGFHTACIGVASGRIQCVIFRHFSESKNFVNVRIARHSRGYGNHLHCLL